jgi:hypothetical protein
MAQTARFVREAGGQAEFVLRVRQAANPAFAFLAPGARCHAFYRWLLDAAPQARGRPGRAGLRDRRLRPRPIKQRVAVMMGGAWCVRSPCTRPGAAAVNSDTVGC